MDVLKAMEGFFSAGEYSGIREGMDISAWENLYGASCDVTVKKHTRIMSYPWGSVTFEDKCIRQLTFDSLTPSQKNDITLLLKKHSPSMVERVEGFGRYYKVNDISPHMESVMYHTSDQDDAEAEVVAVVFPVSEKETLTLTLSKETMHALRKLSSHTRVTIQEICADMIEKHIKEYNV